MFFSLSLHSFDFECDIFCALPLFQLLHDPCSRRFSAEFFCYIETACLVRIRTKTEVHFIDVEYCFSSLFMRNSVCYQNDKDQFVRCAFFVDAPEQKPTSSLSPASALSSSSSSTPDGESKCCSDPVCVACMGILQLANSESFYANLLTKLNEVRDSLMCPVPSV